MTAPKQSNVDRLYGQLLEMIVSFQIRPGARINELQLSEQLQISRTPLREALNRLAAQRFIEFQRGKGYSTHAIKPKFVRDLFQARAAIETYTVQLLADQPDPNKIAHLSALLDAAEQDYPTCSTDQLLAHDEQFHLALAEATGNEELQSMLATLNARIRYVRWIQMDRPSARDTARHRALLAPIAAGDGPAAQRAMADHIETRLEEVTSAVKQAHIRIFIDESDLSLFSKPRKELA